MATAVLMPVMGITMEEGIISSWLVAEGDAVKEGDQSVEFETDKINSSIEAPADGIIGGIQAREGEAVKIQELVCYLLEPGEELPTADSPQAIAESGPAIVPASEASHNVARDITQSDSASTNGRAKATPLARKMAQEQGVDLTSIQGSGPGGRIVAEDLPSTALPPAPSQSSSSEIVEQPTGRVKSSPFARKLASEAGIAIGTLTGSGPKGRIVAADVRAAEAERALAPAPLSSPVSSASVVGTTVPFTGVRRLIADRMVESLSNSAQLTLVSEADATALVGLRNELAAQYEATIGFRIAYNDLFARIAVRALSEHPNMNARLEDDQIVCLPYVNIGLAIDLEGGLAVPNIKNAQDMQLIELACALRDAIGKATEGSLTLDDLTGGTFTITSLGPMDVDAFTPVLNPPECAILGIGRIQPKPAVVENEVAVRQMLTLSLTFDHRLNDGAPAARFLQRIKQLIEHPYLLI